MTFTHDEYFQPLSLTTEDGSITYIYDDQKRLTQVKSNWRGQSSSKFYFYENILFPRHLTGIVDEKGKRFATWKYDYHGRAISSYHGNEIEKLSIVYNTDGTTTVTNALGKQTVYHYTVINGIRKVVRIEGQSSHNCPASNSSYTYNDRGQINTQTDEKGIVTAYKYNDRGLEIKKTEAQGTTEERIILTDWHSDFRLPVKVTEPSRVIEYQYDEKGRLIGQQELPGS
ncbi:RHS repeat protein [Endozoicomonas arenosclerae]|uniref:RHS repeat protein n=1 Tax=Endozoicomonas arenosclerae TaxID=1633495 RepID=UPI0015611B94|nr:RHS repeat protein [Endozoicomonas arenosclerae]